MANPDCRSEIRDGIADSDLPYQAMVYDKGLYTHAIIPSAALDPV